MAKTNPIGVRFREDILESLKKDKLADSPQSALVFLERFYVTHKDKINPLDVLRQNEPKSSKSDTKLPKQENKPTNEPKTTNKGEIQAKIDELKKIAENCGNTYLGRIAKSDYLYQIEELKKGLL